MARAAAALAGGAVMAAAILGFPLAFASGPAHASAATPPLPVVAEAGAGHSLPLRPSQLAAVEPRASHRAVRRTHKPAAPVITAPAVAPAPAAAQSGTLGCAGLESLWDAAGGAPQAAVTAASVAIAESGGSQYAISPTGDVGYWQINAASWGPLASTDPMTNARAAVQISADGSNWTPWTTYTSGAYAGRC